MVTIHADMCAFHFVESGTTTESKNWSPQQPLQAHTGHGLTQGRKSKQALNNVHHRIWIWNGKIMKEPANDNYGQAATPTAGNAHLRKSCKQIRCPRSETSAERRRCLCHHAARVNDPFTEWINVKATTNEAYLESFALDPSSEYQVPWSNERPLENKELNAIIGAWFTLWQALDARKIQIEIIGVVCDVIVITSDKAEGSGDWNYAEYQDTAISKGKEVINGLSFYRIETDRLVSGTLHNVVENGLEAFRW
ncbi:hypothetical protein Tco_0128467 [Tanacetum coccineum]